MKFWGVFYGTKGVTIHPFTPFFLETVERLTKSATGRHILRNLGLRYEVQKGQKVDVPLHIREKLNIPLLPRHMHPVHHAERRMARAKVLNKQLKPEERVIFVDAAEYDKKLKAMTAVAVDREGLIIASCSVKTTEPGLAEEVALALALNTPNTRIVVSDSQTAIRHFARGRVLQETLRVLRGFDKTTKTKLVCPHTHLSLPGNEEAHDAARGLTNRAEVPSEPSTPSLLERDKLVTFRDILGHYASAMTIPSRASLAKQTRIHDVQKA